ncbi:MAG: KamA family radical SAM protein [Candidatus Brocadiales bacterium]|nr:KamA family radical SAM protein [Candidatus Bathyanammoxibius amoris]
MYQLKVEPWQEEGQWQEQIKSQVNTLEKLSQYITVTPDEEKAIKTLNVRWGTTPYYASLMDKNDPDCPIRKMVIPLMKENENKYGIPNYLVFKENREETDRFGEEGKRPDSVARQYDDRVAFTVTDVCASYCRYCFRREVVIDQELDLRLDANEGLEWIQKHEEIRDVVMTGGDPLMLSDENIKYLIDSLRSITHLEIIRIHTKMPNTCPHRITKNLLEILGGEHDIPIWLNVHINHPKEITDKTKKVVWDLLHAGINVGNQGVVLKGINDDVNTFQKLHQKLLSVRIRPYYMFYCQQAPGVDHFRAPIEKGAELIRDGLRGHTSGLAQPMYVVASNFGKIPLMPDYYILEKGEKAYKLQSYKKDITYSPNVPE